MLVVTAVPAAWGVETALRGLLFGTAEFEELRGVLRPALTGVVRGLVVVTVLALWPTWALMRWLVRRRLRALPGRRPDLRVSVRLMAFLGASSVLQAPGVIATFAGLFGADGRAVAGVVGVGTLGLLGLGWVTLRDCVREGPAGAEKNLDGLPPAP